MEPIPGGIVYKGDIVEVDGKGLLHLMLEELREEIRNYYGALNERAMGLKPSGNFEKPEALVRYEQCKDMGIPLIQGGVMDQPHIWLKEWAICAQETQVFESLRRASNATKTPL